MKHNKTIIFCFFGNIIFQIFILNQFLFSNWINPYYYIIFILFLPPKTKHLFVIISSFLIGLLVDVGSGTLASMGPIHAFSSLLLGYFKPKYLTLIRSRGTNLKDFDFNNVNSLNIILYVTFTTITHHLFLFIFSCLSLINLLISTILSSFFTILLLICSYYIFKK